MEKFLPWVVSILTGLMLIAIINLSPLGGLGFGFELSIGWSGTSGQYDCTGKLINGCGDCQPGHEGLPFASSRRLPITCFFETNRLGQVLDTLTGAGLGVLGMAYIFIAEKKQESQSSD